MEGSNRPLSVRFGSAIRSTFMELGDRLGAIWNARERWNTLSDRVSLYVLSATLFTHVLIVAVLMTRNAPSGDELAHVGAGAHLWQTGEAWAYSVNPPLTKLLVAAPLVTTGKPLSLDIDRPHRRVRNDGLFAWMWTQANAGAKRYLILGRLMLLPIVLLTCWLIYAWTSALASRTVGLLAAWTWAFLPPVLTWAPIAQPDFHTTAMFLAAWYAAWRWFVCPTMPRAVVLGMTFGLGLLTKFTFLPAWLLLVPIAGVHLVRNRQRLAVRQPLLQWAAVGLIPWLLINLGYLTDLQWRRLGDLHFVSQRLSGGAFDSGNIFRHGPLHPLPIPLPVEYLYGIDLQWVDVEHGSSGFFNGIVVRDTFAWWFYLAVAAVRLPVTAGLVVIVSLVFAPLVWFADRSIRLGWLCTVLPAGVLLAVLSSQYQFPGFPRYALPCLPLPWVAGFAMLGRLFESRPIIVFCIALVVFLESAPTVLSPHRYINGIARSIKPIDRWLSDQGVTPDRELWQVAAKIAEQGGGEEILWWRGPRSTAHVPRCNAEALIDWNELYLQGVRSTDSIERSKEYLVSRPDYPAFHGRCMELDARVRPKMITKSWMLCAVD